MILTKMCVCVCVCVREREGGREKEYVKQGKGGKFFSINNHEHVNLKDANNVF